MKKLLFTIAASAICGMSFAQTFSVSDVVEVKPGDKAKADLIINIPESYASKNLNGFEFEKLVVDEGITVTDIIPNAEWDPAAQGGIMTGDGFFYGGLLSLADDGLLPLGSDFVIASLEIEVDESVTPGQVLTATFPAGTKFTFTPGVYVDADDYSFNINVVSSYSITLDETSTVAPEPMEGVNVKVLRTINAGNWSTIVLPFDMDENQVKAAFGDKVQIKNFTGYEFDEDADIVNVNFEDVSPLAIAKNHPYIIKVKENISSFVVEGVDIDPVEQPMVNVGSSTRPNRIKAFVGTYVSDFVFYNESNNIPLFLSGNQFWYASEDTQPMMAFRGYFDFCDVAEYAEEDGNSRFVLNFDKQTGINNVTTQQEGEYYNLNGLRVETPSKGIFIKDGKKVVVK